MPQITPTNQVNAANMAKNWGPGVINNSQKWLAKYLAPKALFNANPVQAQQTWQNGINAAIAAGTYATKLGAADPTVAANNASTFGVLNYAAAGTNKAAKYAAKTAALAAAITNSLTTIASMPKGGIQNNLARATAFANAMHAYKGKI